MNLLLLCDKPKKGQNANTLIEHIEAFSKYSEFKVTELNPINQMISSFDNFEIIVVHYSIIISSSKYLSPKFRRQIADSNAIKVVFIQDEYRFINRTIAAMNALSIDILFTCVPEQEIKKVYNTDNLPGVQIFNNLTGYVSEHLHEVEPNDYERRNTDVSYRSREIPAWLGRLGREKIYIAENFPKHVDKTGLKLNIDCTEHGRLYGNSWSELLQDSKAALGTESGASVFDFTGEIQKSVDSYTAKYPNTPFDVLEDKFFKEEEGKIKLNQISPRCFEYAAYGVLMILFEGEYSGILKPWEHYIPLKKDFSNINDVVNSIRNKKTWISITKQAREDLIISGKYSYQAFINFFAKRILGHPKSLISQTFDASITKDYKDPAIQELGSIFLFARNIKYKIISVIYTLFPYSIYKLLISLYKSIIQIKYYPESKVIKFSTLTNLSKGIYGNIYRYIIMNNGDITFCTQRTPLCKKNHNSNDNIDIDNINNKTQIHLCEVCKNYII